MHGRSAIYQSLQPTEVESENNESENEEIYKLIVYPRALGISNQTRSKFFVEVKTAR